MNRFIMHKQRNNSISVFIALILSVGALALFLSASDSWSNRFVQEQKETLERALTRAAVYCYSIEGAYPETLEYLEDAYGITYDKTLFFVDYQVLGSNLMPEITVIERTRRTENALPTKGTSARN